jgi:hypothetical protein
LSKKYISLKINGLFAEWIWGTEPWLRSPHGRLDDELFNNRPTLEQCLHFPLKKNHAYTALKTKNAETPEAGRRRGIFKYRH